MAVGRTVKEKLWRLLCRIKTAVNNIRKGKLKGHLLEVIVVLVRFWKQFFFEEIEGKPLFFFDLS